MVMFLLYNPDPYLRIVRRYVMDPHFHGLPSFEATFQSFFAERKNVRLMWFVERNRLIGLHECRESRLIVFADPNFNRINLHATSFIALYKYGKWLGPRNR